jgi:hypothetical protein
MSGNTGLVERTRRMYHMGTTAGAAGQRTRIIASRARGHDALQRTVEVLCGVCDGASAQARCNMLNYMCERRWQRCLACTADDLGRAALTAYTDSGTNAATGIRGADTGMRGFSAVLAV